MWSSNHPTTPLALLWSGSLFIALARSISVDVVVLGAGPSGLSTLQHLVSGVPLTVAVVEKAPRVGGRIQTLQFPTAEGVVGVDLGPAWIHYGTANPLTYLAKQQNCTLIRTQNLNMDVYHQGQLVPRSIILEMFGLLDRIESQYPKYKDENPPNASLLLVLQQLFRHENITVTAEQQAALAAILFGEVVEDWTAPLHELSAAKHCEYDNVDGVGSDWRIVEGMECILKGMQTFNVSTLTGGGDMATTPIQLLLNQKAGSLRIDGKHVVVEGHGGEWMLVAKAAVVAVPLGELKQGHLKIEPLPRWKEKAWQELGLGHAVRAALEFERIFWSASVEFFMDFISNCEFLESSPSNEIDISDDHRFLDDIDRCSIEFTSPVATSSAAVLVAEVDGRLAMKLQKWSDEQIANFLVSRLAEMFGEQPALKKASIARPWGLPFWHKNSKGRDSAKRAGRPLEQRIFFAGDYVSHNVGTVASAYLSGIAAAHAVLCQLGHPGLDLSTHPAIVPMIRSKCAKNLQNKGGRCKITLWDILYKCSALPDLEDESGRTCFVQGHDKWQGSNQGPVNSWLAAAKEKLTTLGKMLFSPSQHGEEM